MNVLLSNFVDKNVKVFIDDILIMNESFEEHLKLVEEILKTLEWTGIKVIYSMCEWFKTQVEFLGHIVSRTGIKKSEKFVKKVRDFPKPKNVGNIIITHILPLKIGTRGGAQISQPFFTSLLFSTRSVFNRLYHLGFG